MSELPSIKNIDELHESIDRSIHSQPADTTETLKPVEVVAEEFNANETYKKLILKLQELVDAQQARLSLMTKEDFLRFNRDLMLNPNIRLPAELIQENFTNWGNISNPNIVKNDVIAIAKAVKNAINEIPDRDFFGDFSSINDKVQALTQVTRQIATSSAALRIFASEVSTRAQRLKAS